MILRELVKLKPLEFKIIAVWCILYSEALTTKQVANLTLYDEETIGITIKQFIKKIEKKKGREVARDKIKDLLYDISADNIPDNMSRKKYLRKLLNKNI